MDVISGSELSLLWSKRRYHNKNPPVSISNHEYDGVGERKQNNTKRICSRELRGYGWVGAGTSGGELASFFDHFHLSLLPSSPLLSVVQCCVVYCSVVKYSTDIVIFWHSSNFLTPSYFLYTPLFLFFLNYSLQAIDRANQADPGGRNSDSIGSVYQVSLHSIIAHPFLLDSPAQDWVRTCVGLCCGSVSPSIQCVLCHENWLSVPS